MRDLGKAFKALTQAITGGARAGRSFEVTFAQQRKNTPGIPEPFADTPALYSTSVALKIAVETLLRQRGNTPDDSAVMVRDLIAIIDFFDRRYVSSGGEDIRLVTFGAVITDNAGDGTAAGDLNNTDFTGNEYAVTTWLPIATNNLVTFSHKSNAYLWVGPTPRSVGLGGSYTAVAADLAPIGTADHSLLTNRGLADAHPQAAITDLIPDQALQDNKLANLALTDFAQGERLEVLELWRTDHEPGVDPHPQYLLPDELPQTLVSYFVSTTLNNPPDYDLIRTVPGGPMTPLSTTVAGDDILCGKFTGEPIVNPVLYAELETRVILELEGESRATFVYAKGVLNHSGGGITELGTSGAQLLQENRGVYSFTIQILGPVQADAGDFTSVEVYGTKDGGGPSRTVTIYVDHGVSRNITFIPIPAYPAEHAPSHETGQSDEIPELAAATVKNVEQDDRLTAIEDKPYAFFLANYVPNQAVVAGAMANDDGWLMHANKDTSDPAAPQPVGSPYFLYRGANPTDTIVAKQLEAGQRYTWGASGFASAISLYTVTGNSYRVYAIDDPDGAAIKSELVSSFVANTTGISRIPVKQVFVQAGAVFELLAAMEEPSPTPTTIEGNWNYITPNNPAIPGPGDIVHANKALPELRTHKIDDNGGDRSAELASISVGDVANGPGGIRWAIQAISDMGAWINFTVAPAQQGFPDGVSLFVFETVVATPITVVVDSNYWALNPPPGGTIQGRYQIDGGAWVTTDDQYSVDMEVQQATLSPDWDYMLHSSSS